MLIVISGDKLAVVYSIPGLVQEGKVTSEIQKQVTSKIQSIICNPTTTQHNPQTQSLIFTFHFRYERTLDNDILGKLKQLPMKRPTPQLMEIAFFELR